MFGKRKTQTSSKRIPPGANRANAPVFSYYASRSPSDKAVGRQQQVTPRRSFDWRLLPTYLAVMAILLSLAYVSTLSTNPRVVRFSTDDSAVLQPTSVYQAEARKHLDASIFNRSKLLINTRQIERELKDRFPELKSVSIQVPLISRRPIMSITPTKAAMLLTSGSSSFVIDDSGNAVAAAKSLDYFKDLGLPHVTDESGLGLTLGKAALPADDVAFIQEVARQLTSQKLEIDSFTLPTIANELHVRLKGDAYYIKFNLRGDARLQAGTYLAVKQRLARDNIKPVEYIDVRVEEKAFYR